MTLMSAKMILLPSSDSLETEVFTKITDEAAINESSSDAKEIDDLEAKAFEVKSEIPIPEDYKRFYSEYTEKQIATHWRQDGIASDYADRELSDSEKKKYQEEKLKDLTGTIPKEDRDDCVVVAAGALKEVQKGDVPGSYSDVRNFHGDGAKEGTEKSETISKGTYIDRIGHPHGTWACPLKEDGTPYTAKERAIGYVFPEENIKDNASYHKYLVNQTISHDNIQNAINEKYPLESKPEEHIALQARLDSYYEKPYNQKYFKDNNEGIKTSIADKQFELGEDPDGGAKQYDFPLSISELKDLGFLSEVKDKDNE